MSDSYMSLMTKLLHEVGGDVHKLEGESLSLYLHSIKNIYYTEFSRLIANAVSSVPEESRNDLLYMLQDTSSVFGSCYEDYLAIKVPKQVLDETFVVSDSDKDLIEEYYQTMEQGLMSLADFCFALRACNLEVLYFDGSKTLRLLKLRDTKVEGEPVMVRGRTEEYKIKS